MICSVDGCEKPVLQKGFCTVHYTRMRRYGNPHEVRKPRGQALAYFEKLKEPWTDDCIPWPFTVSGRDARPWIQYKGRRGFTSRILCIEVRGDPESEDMHAAHECGNKDCVNIRHIRWLTASGNEIEKRDHGTSQQGSRHGQSKLTEKDVLNIRGTIGAVGSANLARKYGVTRNQILRIVKGDQWRHI